MTPPALEELARKVEQMSSDDGMSKEMRAPNADILRALGWREDHGDVINPDGHLRYQVPYYVGSLDAAMSLVPESYGFQVDGFGNHWWSSLSEDEGFNAHAATPALALTAAALRARATLAREVGDHE